MRSGSASSERPPASVLFDTTYRREIHAMVALATSLTGNRETGFDLAQEAMLRAYRNWPDVSTMDRPGAWIRRVLINLAIDQHRRGTRERRAITMLRPSAAEDHPDQPPPPDGPPVGPPNTDAGVVPPDPSNPSDDPPNSTQPAPATAPVDVPHGLESWPARSQDPKPVHDIPALLPMQPVPNAAGITRWVEAADGSGLYDYTQTWFDSERDAYLIVTTNIDQVPATAEQFRTPVDTSGWESEWETAFFVRRRRARIPICGSPDPVGSFS